MPLTFHLPKRRATLAWDGYARANTGGFRLPDGRYEHNDCTVRALTVAGEVRYADAHAVLELAGRTPRSRFQLKHLFSKPALLELLGLRATVTEFGHFHGRRTLARVLGNLRGKPGRYILRKARHVFTVIVTPEGHTLTNDAYIKHSARTLIHYVAKIERI